jgi:hypothetical protein
MKTTKRAFLQHVPLKILSVGFVVWWFSLQLIGFLAPTFLAYKPSFPYYESLLPSFGFSQSIYSWANFDGVHYVTIVQKGYVGTGLIQAFFPGYPLVVGSLTAVTGNALFSGLVASTLASYILFLVWWSFLKDEFSEKVAWWGVLTLALFPTSFYLRALYGESLFLALVVGSWWAARRRYWAVAVGLAAIASLTRIVGVFLVPALILEYIQQYAELHPTLFSKDTMWATFTSILQRTWWFWFGTTGLVLYMWYLHQYFDDPLYFFHVQAEFGGGRQETLVALPQVFWRYTKIVLTYRPLDLKYLTYLLELAAASITACVLAMQLFWYKKPPFRWGIWFFGVAAYILPTLTGTFSSMPRYILVVLPLTIGLAVGSSKHPRLGFAWIAASTLLLIYTTILFIQGYWIA